MKTSSRTVRVFLSSTFRDFSEERDLLVRKVFPELRRKCRERQVELVDVDLRWGITEKEAQQGKVLPICLAEIDRARPYFIGFIGERYGWIPASDQYDPSILQEQPWLEEHRGGKSVTELEILHGVLNDPAMAGRAFFYFRDPKYSHTKGGVYLGESSEEEEKLNELKDRIRQSGFPVVEKYKSPATLAERVRADLWKLIDEAFPVEEVPDALAMERRRHEAYGASRLGLYLGGDQYFATIESAVRVDPGHPVLVTGESGGGKSALLANWVHKFTSAHPDAIVLTHFLGTCSEAAHSVSMAIRILREIARITGEEFVLEGDPRKALQLLEPWLKKAGAFAREKGRSFILVLDALDKMNEHRDLDWWPRRLPEGVALIVSCLDGGIRDAILPKMQWRELRVSPLKRADCEQFICKYFAKYGKGLAREQTALVLEHPLCGNPLFLRTLLEELRIFGVYKELNLRLKHYLNSETIDDLFKKVLDRIEFDNTPETVRAALEVLWAAKESFAEDELLTVSGLPPAVWAPIHIALDESLIATGGRITFSHDYLRKAVEERYLNSPEDRHSIQKRMAAFCAHAMTAGRKEASRYVRRHAVKHFLEVEDWDNATLALTDLEFIEARAIAQELPEILYDYALARDLLPEREHSRKKAEELRSANDRFTRELIAYSDTWSRIREGSSEVMPQLPRPVGVAPLITSDQIVAERIRIHDFPNRLDCVTDFWKFCATHIKYLSKNSCQQGYVSSTAYNFSPAGPVHAAGARFMQKSEDIKIQRNTDQEYYNPLDPFCGDLEMLQRSPCLAMTPNGKRAVAGDSFHRLWVWDLEKRYCIKILGEEKEYFYSSSRNHAVAMTPCGSRVVSVGWNQELRVWDIESGECIKELVSGKGTVFALAITPCGRRVVSCTGCDRKEETFFQVWDIESGCCVKEVFLYSTTYAVAVSPCGTNALVGSCPGFNYAITKINLDLTEDGYECYEQMKEFALVNKDIKGSNHRGHVRSMAMTPCGTRLISGSEDSKVRVWDLVNGKCLNILEGHESGVTSVAVTPCGRRAISGDLSGTLRVWDLKSGECLKIIVGPDQIYCLALTACGSLAISGHSRGMRIWDVTVGDRINDHMNGSSNISHMALAPNGKHVATQQAGNKIKLWDAKTGRCSSLTELLDLPPCRGFAMSPCGERVIFGGYDRLGFLNLIGNPIIDIVKLLEDSVMSLNVTPCEKFIITLGLDQKLNIWDAKEFQLLEQKTQTFHEVSDLLAISPCGRFIVMGTSIKNSKDRLSLHLWDLESWKIINVFKGHKDSLNEIAFTPCGRFIIAASDDNTLHVWDACGGVTLFELKGHIGPCASIALTPCGKRVVSSCELEDAIRVWDLDTGEQLSIFKVDRPTKILIKSDIVAIAAGHEVFIARHQNLINGPLITTAIKMSFSHDCDSKLVNARTPCCANVISIPEAIADRIEQWTNENGDGSYTDPILLLDCPSCGTPLRMNPFFIDIKTGWLVHGASNLPADDMGAQKLLAPLQERFKTVWREITFEQWKSWADTSMTNSVDGTERPLIHPLVLRFLEYMNDKLDEEQFKNVFNVPNPRKFVSISKFIYTKDFIVETENKRLVGEIAALEVSYAKLTDGTAAKALGIAQLEDKKKELHKLLDVTYLKDIIVDAQATINSKWASLFKHYIIGLNSNINVIFDYDHDDQAKASIIRKLTYASKTNAGVSQGGTAHEVSLSMMRLEVIISSIMRQFIKNCGLGEYLTGELLLPHAHDNEEKYKEFDANIPVNFNKDVDNEFKYISRIYSILNTQIVEYSRDLGHITFSYLKNAMYNGVELFPLFLLAIENNCTQAQKNQLKDDRGKDIAFSDKQIKDSMAALRAKCREEIEDWINAQ